MSSQDAELTYNIWAADNVIYGPVDVPTLIQWIRDGRVQAETWVFSSEDLDWHPAGDVPALQEHLAAARSGAAGAPAASLTAAPDQLSPSALRPFSIFAGLSDRQLEKFLGYGEHCRVAAGELFLKKGDPGDALFFVLEGSVRVRLRIFHEDRTLAVIPAGQFFGEMAMFNRAPRSADVVAEVDTRLFRLSAESFLEMTHEAPDLAAPILFALAGAMARRVSDLNRQFQREVASGFVWS